MTGIAHIRCGRVSELPQNEEEQTRNLINFAFHPFIEIESTGRITDWNPQAESTFGWSRLEAIGQNLFHLIVASEHRDVCEKSVRYFLGSDLAAVPNRRIEITALRRGEHEFPVALTLFAMVGDDVPRLGIFARDLRPPRPTEVEIEEKRRGIADQLAVAYHEVDTRGYITFANQPCEALGLSQVGVSYKKLFVPEAVAQLRDVYSSVYRTGVPARNRYTYIINGETRFHEESISLLRDIDGTPTGFAVVTRDCTDRTRNEIEVVKAKQAAEAAGKAKGEFLANVSHEIRTPLNGVLGMLELITETELTGDQRELLKLAQISARNLLTVINDILDFSRISAGKLELDNAEFDLVRTVDEAVRSLALAAHKKGLELAYEVAVDVPRFLRGDSTRLKQVLINLIGNAVKFTDKGEVVLWVECTRTLKTGPAQLRFSVCDTGIGISAEAQQLIFEAFSQADSSSTRKYGGTGLGLAICSGILKLMGTRLEVQSQDGRGATFHFATSFPVVERARTADAEPMTVGLQGLRVLVVDDNPTNRQILQRMIALRGMLPVMAESGEVALQLLSKAASEQKLFELVLVDCQMPEMDGFQVVEKIHNDPSLRMPAILMLTSDDYQSSARRARELGIDACLVKPIQQSELLSQICDLLRPAQANRATRAAIRQEEESSPPMSILLVEDNLVNQKLVVRLAERMGHTLTIAGNGKQALARLQEASFDLVLMDVEMPEMNGFAATSAIRAEEQKNQCHLPIIAMTAHAMTGDQERCLKAGMDDYVSKPISFDELKEAITRVVKVRPARSLEAPFSVRPFSNPDLGDPS